MKFNKGDIFHGFTVTETEELNEYRSVGVSFLHKQSGCELYHVINDDEENFFSYIFRTPPTDSTGVAHILEHSVLCGSEQYPLKDPFLVLMKGSVNTFLNAMTYPDRTVYPAGTVVEKDFFNLLDVYGDAVFFPLLKKEMFHQEGIRLELNDEKLDRVGIVFNEMKAHYSSENSIAGEWSLRSIFSEGHPYSVDSGGDPKHIPDLSYEEFVAFHKKWYHPSNSRIALYGNIDTIKILEHLDRRFLSKFNKISINSEIPRQEHWDSPRMIEKCWPSSPDEPLEGKTTIAINWLLGSSNKMEQVIILDLLSEILLGHAGSPLYKVIADTPLCEDLSPVSGVDIELNDITFSVACRGANPESRDDFVSLVFDELKRLATEGIDPEVVESALRQIEFKVGGIGGSSSKGLSLVLRLTRAWVHGAKPSATLQTEDALARVREMVQDPDFLKETILNSLIDNSHYSVVVVKPDAHMQDEATQAERKELDDIQKSLSDEDVKKIKDENRLLTIFQEQEDSAQDMARIPFLDKKELPKEVRKIPSIEHLCGSDRIYMHDIATNGITYLDLFIPLPELNYDDIMLLPVFCDALTGMGMGDLDYIQTSQEIALKTGSLGCTVTAETSLDGTSTLTHFHLRIKMLNRLLPEALDLLENILLNANFNDTERLNDIILEMRNDIKSDIIRSGNGYVSQMARSCFTEASLFKEKWDGISHYLYLREFSAENIVSRLDSLRDKVIRRGGAFVNITTSGDSLSYITKRMEGFFAQLKESLGGRPTLDFTRSDSTIKGLAIPSTVNFVSAVMPGAPIFSEGFAAQALAGYYLKTGPLWETVRMKGGAYGAAAGSFGKERLFGFSSYRDPNISETLRWFKSSLDKTAKGFSSEDLDLTLVGFVGHELTPLRPATLGLISLRRKLSGITDEMRQGYRDDLLSLEPNDIRQCAQKLLDQWDSSVVTILGGEEALKKATKELSGLQGNIEIIPF